MGTALTRINLDVLAQFMGFHDIAEIKALLPAGFNDHTQRTVHMLLDSTEFAPNMPGMAVPEVCIDYVKTAKGLTFNGFSWPDEPIEMIPSPQQMGAPPFQPPPDPNETEDDSDEDSENDEDEFDAGMPPEGSPVPEAPQ